MSLVKFLRILPLAFIVIFSSCNRGDALFTSVPSSTTNITFANNLEKRESFGILYFLYYYNGGGVAVGDINNDGLPDIYFTANSTGNNKLYLNKGNLEFQDVTSQAGVAGIADWSSGVTMADVNADGFLDIYVSAISNAYGLHGRNQLFINNKNGTFTDRAEEYGLHFSGFTTQAAFFDYDHDGDLDCYLLNQSHRPNDNIVDTSNRRRVDPLAGDRLYRNELNTGSSKFTDVSAKAGIYQSSLGYGLGLGVADINNDGWDDIYVGNDFHENDYYYVNNGDGTFTESSASHFGHFSRFSMGNDIADYNNDGQLDIITADMLPPDEKVLKTYGSEENSDIYEFKISRNGFQYQVSRNCLQRNNGNGSRFSEVGLISGVSATDWSWAPLFADFDNDGNKDLFVSSGIVKRPVDLDYVRFVSNLYMQKGTGSGENYDEMALEKMPDGSSHPFLFKGNGDLSFKDVSEEWGSSDLKGYFNGAAYADLDNDGDLDIVMNPINETAVILRNNSTARQSLSVSFKGEGLNTSGLGTKIYLFNDGKLQYQQLMLTRGFQSSVEPRMVFGLDSLTSIDSILVVWPDQRFQWLKNVNAKDPLRLEQSKAGGKFNYQDFNQTTTPVFTDITGQVAINWKHRENKFVDNNVQYLIPHGQSTRGPKLAVADLNNDGLDEIFVCGASGQSGVLLRQQSSGQFSVDSTAFAADAAAEDVDAIFFDANNDGYSDLYVVSGGNEYSGQNLLLLDRLYLNDGRGTFRKSNTIPAIYENKSCITAADIDKDGDQDLFVGVLADPKAYGIPQTSYLLVNDGAGNFSASASSLIPLGELGIVTSAGFSDLNNDSWPDLVVAGEWMPLTIFINRQGRFEKSSIDKTSGWWQTISMGDFNGDNIIDILGGNWGWNSKLWSGKNGPVRLYVNDFDRNKQTDHLLSYTLNDKEYPFLAKDEVERALPLLRKHYLYYADYAGVPMKDVFYGWIDTIQPKIAERFGSVICYGDGKGSFIVHDLPPNLQLAPIFSFHRINSPSSSFYMAGGNFFDVIPYEGRYDAQALGLFEVSANKLSYVHQPNLQLNGQVRDIKTVRTSHNRILVVVARNNQDLVFLNPNR